MLRWVDSLLYRWGRWAIRSVTQSVGYCRYSPMFRDFPSDPGGGYKYSYDPDFQARDIYDIDHAVSQLQRATQNVLAMKYVMQMSDRAIAAQLDCSRTRVRCILSTAHEEIARSMEKETA